MSFKSMLGLGPSKKELEEKQQKSDAVVAHLIVMAVVQLEEAMYAEDKGASINHLMTKVMDKVDKVTNQNEEAIGDIWVTAFHALTAHKNEECPRDKIKYRAYADTYATLIGTPVPDPPRPNDKYAIVF